MWAKSRGRLFRPDRGIRLPQLLMVPALAQRSQNTCWEFKAAHYFQFQARCYGEPAFARLSLAIKTEGSLGHLQQPGSPEDRKRLAQLGTYRAKGRFPLPLGVIRRASINCIVLYCCFLGSK
ncbi:hypothetical protein N658DRAFT_255209 [Parathielavia hyrcaniae]|uniref:Uncharacterized protein n=1 Tax=Parathielavia hyrcaniae TaxID=113614 RepID=A0AAN6PZ42_9PEZI|nr:hypothetical protein N658DRAFT_255209 [Parathielavia hyrcaniae]